MRKAQDIMGLPVIEIETGKQIGTAKDFLIDRDWNLQGVLLETKHWFSAPRYVKWDHVISFGADAVTIPDGQSVQTLEDGMELCYFEHGSSKLKGLPIITVNGTNLGMVEDVYFGEQWGKKIVGYELSDGLLADWKDGRKWLPAPEDVTIGADAIIVPGDCDTQLQDVPTFQ
ncbi:PRC-barrel domain-containing protein [Paenibacillus koleovorans]|uniref:PRC-barrel domain-containing protein n=1 Tax=Paenibacillus koleovorans TaxID=121608 RepID=UPI000FD93904|nr:PRC-barrel domain-containing protein [Paenibacillus koleovorans]